MERSPGPVGRYYAFELTQAAAFTLPIFAVFFQLRGLSLAEIGLIEAVYTVTSIVAETPTGYLGDRLGLRRALLASALLGGAGAAAFAFAHALWAFLLVIVVRAIAGAFRSGTGDAWLYELLAAREEYDEASFARARGRASAVSRASTAGSVLVGGGLYALDPTAPWLVEGGVVVTGGLLALTLPAPDGEAQRTEESTVGPLAALRAARATLSTPSLRRFVLYTAVVFGVVAGAHVVVQPVAVGLADVDPAALGLLYAGMVSTSAVASEGAGRIRERVGIDRWFLLAPPIAGLVLLGGVAVPPVVLVAFVALWGLRAVSGPLANQYLNDRTDSTARATTLSAAAMVRGLVSAPTKLAAGAVAGGSLVLVVVGLSGLLLAAGAVVALLGGPAPDATPERAESVPAGEVLDS